MCIKDIERLRKYNNETLQKELDVSEDYVRQYIIHNIYFCNRKVYSAYDSWQEELKSTKEKNEG